MTRSRPFFAPHDRWTESLVLMGLLALAVGAATLIEAAWGSSAAREVIYHAWWMYLIYAALTVEFICLSRGVRLRERKRWGVLVLHYGLITILLGALLTHLFGYQGQLHIRQGATTNTLLLADGTTQTLPFQVGLEQFTLKRHPVSNTPAWFESRVRIDKGEEQRISMNNKLTINGFRLYQSSYDLDERGTILSVNHDPLGSTVSYVGYFLLMAGLVLSLAQRKSRLRTLYTQITHPEESHACIK